MSERVGERVSERVSDGDVVVTVNDSIDVRDQDRAMVLQQYPR